MKKIYIILSYTGTVLSRLVRIYTREEYSHVSISLDKTLDHMYSFGRFHAYNPFFAGFVQEHPHYGTFKRFKKTNAKIYSLEVKDEDYEKIKEAIDYIAKNKDKYSFNIGGIVFAMVHYHLKRERSFYCAEFVKYVLDNTSMELELPEVIKPTDFIQLKGLKEEYSGILQDYLPVSFCK